MPDAKSYERARRFRAALTPPEARLWVHLRKHQLRDLGFRRQHPIGPYILDFFCARASLAVEVDGATHDTEEQMRHDQRRTRWLAGRGIRVIRIAARDVRDELDGVLTFIAREAADRLMSAPPPPSRG